MTKPVLAVDFDATLCEFAYPGIGAPKPGAKEALKMFREIGYQVVIYSCRTCYWNTEVFGGGPSMERQTVKDMVTWLAEHGIEYDEIDDGSRGKIMAAAYIDDKGVRFDNNWNQIAAWVYTRRPL